ncbi:MAG: outer membrane lipoprotein carrier protein LolA [Verrucomicrobia bacterium]|nr:outer membrane lipoprotein carrier protein LolA [Verrucomicrobiota bacterium]
MVSFRPRLGIEDTRRVLSRVRRLGLTLVGMLTLGSLLLAHAQTPESLLVHWLNKQEGLESWSADLIQTRRLPSLTRPLTAPGKVWFTAPNQFRWELGQPAQSIAVRDGSELLILSPRLKRGERYPLGQLAQGPMKEALALLDSGFPRNAADFQSRFELLSISNAPPAIGFQVRPRAAGTRELMPGLRLWVETNTWQLQATELQFADGSSLRNDFTNAVRNPTNPASLFRPTLDASWKVTEMAPPTR